MSYNELRRIGRVLMKDEYPRIFPGGVIALDTPPDLIHKSSAKDEALAKSTEGSRGSAARQGQGSQGWERSAGGAWPPVPEAPLFGEATLSGEYERRLGEVRTRYPKARFRVSPDALWLNIRTRPILSCPEESLLVMRLPEEHDEPVMSWAWWFPGLWIGPRHTNAPNGSICSFEPRDRTWHRGLGIDRLLDLHMLWIVRHLHLRVFGFWPGPQSNQNPLERVLEQDVRELCGCGSGYTYGECHKLEDVHWMKCRGYAVQSVDFERAPPRALLSFLTGTSPAPNAAALGITRPN